MLDVIKVIIFGNCGGNHGMASGQQYGTSYSGGKCIKAEYE